MEPPNQWDVPDLFDDDDDVSLDISLNDDASEFDIELPVESRGGAEWDHGSETTPLQESKPIPPQESETTPLQESETTPLQESEATPLQESTKTTPLQEESASTTLEDWAEPRSRSSKRRRLTGANESGFGEAGAGAMQDAAAFGSPFKIFPLQRRRSLSPERFAPSPPPSKSFPKPPLAPIAELIVAPVPLQEPELGSVSEEQWSPIREREFSDTWASVLPVREALQAPGAEHALNDLEVGGVGLGLSQDVRIAGENPFEVAPREGSAESEAPTKKLDEAGLLQEEAGNLTAGNAQGWDPTAGKIEQPGEALAEKEKSGPAIRVDVSPQEGSMTAGDGQRCGATAIKNDQQGEARADVEGSGQTVKTDVIPQERSMTAVEQSKVNKRRREQDDIETGVSMRTEEAGPSLKKKKVGDASEGGSNDLALSKEGGLAEVREGLVAKELNWSADVAHSQEALATSVHTGAVVDVKELDGGASKEAVKAAPVVSTAGASACQEQALFGTRGVNKGESMDKDGLQLEFRDKGKEQLSPEKLDAERAEKLDGSERTDVIERLGHSERETIGVAEETQNNIDKEERDETALMSTEGARVLPDLPSLQVNEIFVREVPPEVRDSEIAQGRERWRFANVLPVTPVTILFDDEEDEIVLTSASSKKAQYQWVKWEGLPHLCNEWVPEKELKNVKGGAQTLAAFQRGQAPVWLTEWTQPERVIAQRGGEDLRTTQPVGRGGNVDSWTTVEASGHQEEALQSLGGEKDGLGGEIGDLRGRSEGSRGKKEGVGNEKDGLRGEEDGLEGDKVAEGAGKREDVQEWLVKWKGLGYADCTWETGDWLRSLPEGEALIKRFWEIETAAHQKTKTSGPASSTSERLSELLTAGGGNKLMQHQKEAVDWLKERFVSRQSAMLADEAGMGKLVTTVALLLSLLKEGGASQPAFILASKDALLSWERVLAEWAPRLYAVRYEGSAADRAAIEKYEIGQPCRADMVLISLDDVKEDALSGRFLPAVRWEIVVLDESRAKSAPQLPDLDAKRRLLLTSEDPFSQSLDDSWHEVHFLGPSEPSLSKREWRILKSEEQANRKERILAGCVLRRTKAEAFSELLPTKEKWIAVPMTPVQVDYYRQILVQSYPLVSGGLKRSLHFGKQPLESLIQTLLKCCNHPYLAGLPISNDHASFEEGLLAGIRASAKLQQLDMLLHKAKEAGERVIVLTHHSIQVGTQGWFIRSPEGKIDLLKDYALRRFGEESVCALVEPQSAKKEEVLSSLNARDSKQWLILLSSKAALQRQLAIDRVKTVIILDNERDLQHEVEVLTSIQTHEPINVVRILTEGTVEEAFVKTSREEGPLWHDTKGRTKHLSAELCQTLLQWKLEELFEAVPKAASLALVRSSLEAESSEPKDLEEAGTNWCRDEIDLRGEDTEEKGSLDKERHAAFWKALLAERFLAQQAMQERERSQRRASKTIKWDESDRQLSREAKGKPTEPKRSDRQAERRLTEPPSVKGSAKEVKRTAGKANRKVAKKKLDWQRGGKKGKSKSQNEVAEKMLEMKERMERLNQPMDMSESDILAAAQSLQAGKKAGDNQSNKRLEEETRHVAGEEMHVPSDSGGSSTDSEPLWNRKRQGVGKSKIAAPNLVVQKANAENGVAARAAGTEGPSSTRPENPNVSEGPEIGGRLPVQLVNHEVQKETGTENAPLVQMVNLEAEKEKSRQEEESLNTLVEGSPQGNAATVGEPVGASELRQDVPIESLRGVENSGAEANQSLVSKERDIGQATVAVEREERQEGPGGQLSNGQLAAVEGQLAPVQRQLAPVERQLAAGQWDEDRLRATMGSFLAHHHVPENVTIKAQKLITGTKRSQTLFDNQAWAIIISLAWLATEQQEFVLNHEESMNFAHTHLGSPLTELSSLEKVFERMKEYHRAHPKTSREKSACTGGNSQLGRRDSQSSGGVSSGSLQRGGSLQNEIAAPLQQSPQRNSNQQAFRSVTGVPGQFFGPVDTVQTTAVTSGATGVTAGAGQQPTPAGMYSSAQMTPPYGQQTIDLEQTSPTEIRATRTEIRATQPEVRATHTNEAVSAVAYQRGSHLLQQHTSNVGARQNAAPRSILQQRNPRAWLKDQVLERETQLATLQMQYEATVRDINQQMNAACAGEMLYGGAIPNGQLRMQYSGQRNAALCQARTTYGKEKRRYEEELTRLRTQLSLFENAQQNPPPPTSQQHPTVRTSSGRGLQQAVVATPPRNSAEVQNIIRRQVLQTDPLAREEEKLLKEEERVKDEYKKQKQQVEDDYLREVEALKAKYEGILKGKASETSAELERLKHIGTAVTLNKELAFMQRIKHKALEQPDSTLVGALKEAQQNAFRILMNETGVNRTQSQEGSRALSANPGVQQTRAQASNQRLPPQQANAQQQAANHRPPPQQVSAQRATNQRSSQATNQMLPPQQVPLQAANLQPSSNQRVPTQQPFSQAMNPGRQFYPQATNQTLPPQQVPPRAANLPPSNHRLPPQQAYSQATNHMLPPQQQYLQATNQMLPPQQAYPQAANQMLPPQQQYPQATNQMLPPQQQYPQATNQMLPLVQIAPQTVSQALSLEPSSQRLPTQRVAPQERTSRQQFVAPRQQPRTMPPLCLVSENNRLILRTDHNANQRSPSQNARSNRAQAYAAPESGVSNAHLRASVATEAEQRRQNIQVGSLGGNESSQGGCPLEGSSLRLGNTPPEAHQNRVALDETGNQRVEIQGEALESRRVSDLNEYTDIEAFLRSLDEVGRERNEALDLEHEVAVIQELLEEAALPQRDV